MCVFKMCTQLSWSCLVENYIRQAVTGRRGHQVGNCPPQGHIQSSRGWPENCHGNIICHTGNIMSIYLETNDKERIPYSTYSNERLKTCRNVTRCVCLCALWWACLRPWVVRLPWLGCPVFPVCSSSCQACFERWWTQSFHSWTWSGPLSAQTL